MTSDPVFTPGEWIIGFSDESEDGWWNVFTRPGFRHCFAFRYLQPMDAWALVDWSNFGLQVDFVPKRMIDALIVGVNERGGGFIAVDAVKPPRRFFPFVPIYCVSAVKELVGLRSFATLTPWQLYCALMKKGARRMFELRLKENGT